MLCLQLWILACDSWNWCRHSATWGGVNILRTSFRNRTNLIIWLAKLTNIKAESYFMTLSKTKKKKKNPYFWSQLGWDFLLSLFKYKALKLTGLLRDPWKPGPKFFFSLFGCWSPHSSLQCNHIGSFDWYPDKILCSTPPQSCFTYSVFSWNSPVVLYCLLKS